MFDVSLGLSDLIYEKVDIVYTGLCNSHKMHLARLLLWRQVSLVDGGIVAFAKFDSAKQVQMPMPFSSTTSSKVVCLSGSFELH